ncbi:MAG: sigma-54 interaction domain-containing protein [Planctomycetota bacterium]
MTVAPPRGLPRGAPAPTFDLEPVATCGELRTASPVMRRVLDACERVARTDATVLLLGETGTGKELLARTLHRASRRGGRFVAIDLGAVPTTLIESELFGHEKGAFTGASRRRQGVFELAHEGTLLLDEVGHLPPAVQHHLLRVLQERRVRPVGAEQEAEVDVRVIAATSAPLYDAVAAGSFRQDLLYRLDVIRLEVPPLRQRPEDVLFLFQHFCGAVAERYGLPLPAPSAEFARAMLDYPWPGNVRQLENVAERLMLTGARAEQGADFQRLVCPSQGRAEVPGAAPPAAPQVDLELPLVDFLAACERSYLEAALRRRRGRIHSAADLAGISRRTLLRKLTRYGIDKYDYRS